MEKKQAYDKKVIAGHQNPEARDFWQDRLGKENYIGSFPYDYRETPLEKGTWSSLEIPFSTGLNDKLLTATKQSDYALHIILSLGLALLLDRYSYYEESPKDIMFISPIFKQEQEGEFINTILPLCITIDSDPTFKTFLQQVKKVLMEAVHNQNYPVELLIRQMNLSPSLDSPTNLAPGSGTGNLFFSQVALLLENIHDAGYIRHIDFTALFSFNRLGDKITGKIEYDGSRFLESTMQQVARHFASLLEDGLFHPDNPISQLEMMTPKEKETLLVTYNQTQADYPAAKTIDALIAEQAQANPHRVAVVYAASGDSTCSGDIDITYKELDEKARYLARVLQKKGVKKGDIVSIIVQPSIHLVVALLGVLKAGAAFLPIDPSDPSERIFYLLEDSRSSLLLTTRNLYDIGIKELDGDENRFDVIVLDEALEETPPDSLPPLDVPGTVDPAELPAYVIYTSGTTGKPKGVLVQHQGVVNYASWRITAYELQPDDVTLQLLSYSFDGFGSNIYSCLFSGGTLVLIPAEKKMDYPFIKEVIIKNKVTNFSLVPPMYEALLNFTAPSELNSLKFVVLGGERAASSLIRDASMKIPGIRHIIEYGPTETSIGAVANLSTQPHETAIIGSPIANTEVYILGPAGQLQPPCVPGELCIAGPQLALGYINNTKLSEEKFARGPYQPPEARLYRSGDLARWLVDGRIELLGRIDQQVKIRGFRVELKEIETLLGQHPQVDRCIVITTPTPSGQGQEIAAFYQAPESLTSTAVREYLAQSLPEYMIPARIIRVDEFPLTPNGKIDRKTLALYSENRTDENLRQPRNPIEQRIMDVWVQVIGNDNFGIDNAFFDIGGTSITAMAVIAQLGKEFDITIDHIYSYGTIAEIAKNVSWAKDNLKGKIAEIKEQLTQPQTLSPGEREEAAQIQQEIEEQRETYLDKIKEDKLPTQDNRHAYKHILITGATGFFGSHTVYEFLENTSAQLYLLVRADTPGEAAKRLEEKFVYYFGKDSWSANQSRFEIIHGDIRADNLGIEDSFYDHLCDTIDAIVHTAARVSYIGMYEDFFKSNVVGTQNLLQLAGTGKKKDFHHISDLGVATGNIPGKRSILFTEFSPESGAEDQNPYHKSKLEAERAVLEARAKGIKTSIYRLASLFFDTRTGKFHEKIANNAFYARLKAFYTLGMAPSDWNRVIGTTFVDQAAQAVTLLALNKDLENQVYHLHSPNYLDWKKIVPLLEAAKLELKSAKLGELLDHMTACLDQEKHMEVVSQLLLYSGAFGSYTGTGTQPQTNVHVLSQRTTRILEQLGFQWLDVTPQHIGKMVEHCKQVNYL